MLTLRVSLALVAALSVPLPVTAQDSDVLKTPAEKLLSEAKATAFIGVDVWVGDGKKKLTGVTVLVEDGKVKEVGKDLSVPPSYERVVGGCLTPGIVMLGSTVGQSGSRPAAARSFVVRGRRFRGMPSRGGSSRATYTPNVKVTSKLRPMDGGWAEFLKAGVTTHAVRPVKSGLSGLGGVVRPLGRKVEDMVLADERYLYIGMASNTAHKKLLRDNFKKAKELIEARKKKPAAKTPAKPATKPGAKPTTTPKAATTKAVPQPKPQPKPGGDKPKPVQSKPTQATPTTAKKPAAPKKKPEDPKLVVLAKAIEKKLAVMLSINSGGDLLHALDALSDTDFPLVLMHQFSRGATDTPDHMVAQLKKRKVRCVLSADLGYAPNTRYFVNPIAKLMKAGVEVVLVPGRQHELKTLWFRLNELARAGISRAKLVEAISGAPAKLVGVQNRVGTIAKGMDANLLHFSRDPFSPATHLVRVYFEGRAVKGVSTKH
ncbi:MAG: hypothetical protein CMJ85_01160 [Planctomycetes bacterium]|nr:hypothetical protein [Planctomycetota bacterium]MDP6424926.1 hypothetical protein [Planctomycetota bacterium]